MRIEIEIPEEFESDYTSDKFKDFFSRVLCDIEDSVICGNYEEETAEMMLKAFDESKTAYNVEKVISEIRTQFGCKDCEYTDEFQHPACNECAEFEVIDDICNIVKRGGVE